jgi:hypothetical protein
MVLAHGSTARAGLSARRPLSSRLLTVAASLLLAMLVKYAWPAHLEEEIDHSFSPQSARGNQMFEEDGAS